MVERGGWGGKLEAQKSRITTRQRDLAAPVFRIDLASAAFPISWCNRVDLFRFTVLLRQLDLTRHACHVASPPKQTSRVPQNHTKSKAENPAWNKKSMILSTITTDNYKRHQREVILSPRAKRTNDSDRCLCTPSDATPQVLQDYNKKIHVFFDVPPPLLRSRPRHRKPTRPSRNRRIIGGDRSYHASSSVSMVSSISRCFRAMSTMPAHRRQLPER